MLKRVKSMGYVEVTLTQESLFGAKGWKLRGHEFHYSDLIDDPTQDGAWRAAYRMKRCRTEKPVPEGFQRGRTLVSYVHIHFASRPASVERFVSMCRRVPRGVSERYERDF